MNEVGPLTPREFAARHFDYIELGRQRCPVQIRRTCGHDEVLDLTIGSSLQDVERLQRDQCSACVEAWEAATAEAAIVAEHRAQQLGLAPLLGTAKQVAWANRLRIRAIDRHGLDQIGHVIDGETWSKWWIDNRARLHGMRVFREWNDTRQPTGGPPPAPEKRHRGASGPRRNPG